MDKFLYFASVLILLAFTLAFNGCASDESADRENQFQEFLDEYTTFELNADLGDLTENQKKMISLLIDAGEAMDDVFWLEAYGNKNLLLDAIEEESLKRYVEINYGPWDRLNANRSFIDSVGPKPAGAGYER